MGPVGEFLDPKINLKNFVVVFFRVYPTKPLLPESLPTSPCCCAWSTRHPHHETSVRLSRWGKVTLPKNWVILGYVGDDILPSYMGILNNPIIRIPIKQPVCLMEVVGWLDQIIFSFWGPFRPIWPGANCHVSFGEEKNVLSIRVIVLEDTNIHQKSV